MESEVEMATLVSKIATTLKDILEEKGVKPNHVTYNGALDLVQDLQRIMSSGLPSTALESSFFLADMLPTSSGGPISRSHSFAPGLKRALTSASFRFRSDASTQMAGNVRSRHTGARKKQWKRLVADMGSYETRLHKALNNERTDSVCGQAGGSCDKSAVLSTGDRMKLTELLDQLDELIPDETNANDSPE